MRNADDAFKEDLRCALEALDTEALGVGKKINASYMIQYHGSLIGKDFKLLMQCGAFAFAPLVRCGKMKKLLWNCWRSLGDLGRLLWMPVIPNMEAHLVCVIHKP